MKIAIVTPIFNIAGVPLAQHRFARALAQRNHEVEFIIGFLPSSLYPPDVPGLKINILKNNRVFKMFFKLFFIFKKNKFDIIFSAEDHLNVVVILANFLSGSKAKISASSRVTPLDTYSDTWFSKRWFLKQLTKLTMKRANVLSCVSKDMVLQYQSMFKNSTHQAIYNIVDDKFSRAKMLEKVDHRWFDENHKKLIIASGRLATWKGFEDLIRAMPFVLKKENVRLIILGDGPLKESLQNLIQDLDLNSHVELLGYVNNPLKYYKKADVFVLSSHVEGLPNVLVEAMMCGCTPVSTDCPTGPREVLEGGKYGYLVPMKNPKSLAQGIIQALKTPISEDLLNEAVLPFEENKVLEAHTKALRLTTPL